MVITQDLVRELAPSAWPPPEWLEAEAFILDLYGLADDTPQLWVSQVDTYQLYKRRWTLLPTKRVKLAIEHYATPGGWRHVHLSISATWLHYGGGAWHLGNQHSCWRYLTAEEAIARLPHQPKARRA